MSHQICWLHFFSTKYNKILLLFKFAVSASQNCLSLACLTNHNPPPLHPLGVNCEGEVNECSLLSPCQNQGVCVDEVNGYRCQCLQGYTGVNCEVNIDDCVSQPCLNGGQCMDDVSGYVCQCGPGYTGGYSHRNLALKISELYPCVAKM